RRAADANRPIGATAPHLGVHIGANARDPPHWPIARRSLSAMTLYRPFCAAELSWLTAAQLTALLDKAFYARQISDGDAFLLAFDQKAIYESPNYLWFRERY